MKTTTNQRQEKKLKKTPIILITILTLTTILVTPASATNTKSKTSNPPNLLLPKDGITIDDPTPTFKWTPENKAKNYRLLVYENLHDRKIIETSPEGLNNPNTENTIDIWMHMIRNAENTILIETQYVRYYDNPNDVNTSYIKLIKALKNAAIQGVKIKLLTPDPDLGIKFIAEHPNVHLKEDIKTHAKILIVDLKEAYVGSANWSGTGTVNLNREIGLYTTNEKLAESYGHIFNTGWTKAGGDEIDGTSLNEVHGVTLTGHGQNMPNEINTITKTETNMIQNAENQILAYYYYFSNSNTVDKYEEALIDAAERGVKVKLLFNTLKEDRRIRISHKNIETRIINLQGFRHAHPKMLIVDSRIAHLGSANWTGGSHEKQRREVGAKITHQKLVSHVTQIFYTDWNSDYITHPKNPEKHQIKPTTNLPIIDRTLNSDTSSYEIIEDLPDGKYYWKVETVNFTGENSSQARTFKIETPSYSTRKIMIIIIILGSSLAVGIYFLYRWKK